LWNCPAKATLVCSGPRLEPPPANGRAGAGLRAKERDGVVMRRLPTQELAAALRQNGMVRFIEHFAVLFPDCHLKDLVVDEVGPDRSIVVNGHRVINFGCDSFLGLDQDPRVQEALMRGTRKWGTHNGASRAFASVRANVVAEEKLAAWLGTEAA